MCEEEETYKNLYLNINKIYIRQNKIIKQLLNLIRKEYRLCDTSMYYRIYILYWLSVYRTLYSYRISTFGNNDSKLLWAIQGLEKYNDKRQCLYDPSHNWEQVVENCFDEHDWSVGGNLNGGNNVSQMSGISMKPFGYIWVLYVNDIIIIILII